MKLLKEIDYEGWNIRFMSSSTPGRFYFSLYSGTGMATLFTTATPRLWFAYQQGRKPNQKVQAFCEGIWQGYQT